jgi:hypothetical protein
MSPFEALLASELTTLLRAGVTTRTVRITVRELLIGRMERGPLGAEVISGDVEAALRAACRLVRERAASDDLVEIVCRAALEAVRGHGGESARWLREATNTAFTVLQELALEQATEPNWLLFARRLPRW